MVRITRAAEMTFDEESDEDFSQVMAEALSKQRQSNIVRVEASLDHEADHFLMKKLGIFSDKVYRMNSWFDLKSIAQLAYQPIFQEFKRPVWQPRPVLDFETSKTLFPFCGRLRPEPLPANPNSANSKHDCQASHPDRLRAFYKKTSL